MHLHAGPELSSRTARLVTSFMLRIYITTFARLAQATEYIPRDRVIDGIDQTALLLNGEHHGRRDYVYIYENEILRSIVKQEFKMHMPAPGVPGAAAPVFNLYRDPREEHPQIGMALWSGASFQDMAKRHMMTIAKYPHLKLGKGQPLRWHREPQAGNQGDR